MGQRKTNKTKMTGGKTKAKEEGVNKNQPERLLCGLALQYFTLEGQTTRAGKQGLKRGK